MLGFDTYVASFCSILLLYNTDGSTDGFSARNMCHTYDYSIWVDMTHMWMCERQCSIMRESWMSGVRTLQYATGACPQRTAGLSAQAVPDPLPYPYSTYCRLKRTKPKRIAIGAKACPKAVRRAPACLAGA